MVADRDMAVTGIQQRDSIGGVALDRTGSEVLTASAAGQVPSEFMREIADQLQASVSNQLYEASRAGAPDLPPQLPQTRASDVVPLSADDLNGVGIIAGIPLTVGALLCGIAMALAIAGV